MRSATKRMRTLVQHAETIFSYRAVLKNDPCVYCVLWPNPERAADPMTLEHIHPLSEGGENGWRNYSTAHRGCNENRSSIPLLMYLVYRQQVQALSGREYRLARKRVRRTLTGAVHGKIAKRSDNGDQLDQPGRSVR